ncbi:hypothetical protein GOV08_03610 [Candidatus Woesearchaeota archaeon]|nr:hypothetical protein [Candidatus Woesearchaeota archaeon]
MDEKKLLKISIIISIAGVVGLFIVSSLIHPKLISISDVDESHIGKIVAVKGEVTKIFISGNRTIIYIDDSLVSFTIFSKVEIEKGKKVEITGKVEEYQDNLQIIVDKLQIIN